MVGNRTTNTHLNHGIYTQPVSASLPAHAEPSIVQHQL